MYFIQYNQTTASDNWVEALGMLTAQEQVEVVTSNDVEKNYTFWAESSRTVCQSWTPSSAHTGPPGHTGDTTAKRSVTVHGSEELTGELKSESFRSSGSNSTYHWKVAMLFPKAWQVIILKSFQNIMQVIDLEIRELFFF